MTEEKQEKKKPGIIRRIFGWIGLGLLVALIMGALIYDAPWKVLALLLILLAAHTILPKAAIKWFWLSVAGAVVILIIWVFLPDKDGDWQPYKYNFDEELAAIEAKHVIPDELNAATIYNKLLQDYDWEDFYSSLSPEDQEKLPMREPWLSKEHPKIAEWLQQQQDTIEKLLEASKMERCLFRISEPENFEKQIINRNAAIRRWAFLLVSAVNNDIAEDHVDEALQKNLTLLQMGNHLFQQRTKADLLVGMAIRALALPELRRFIITGAPEETHLRAMEEALENVKCDWGSDLIRILESDKLSTKRWFARYYEINPKGKIRLSRDPLAEIRANCRKALKNEKIDDWQLRDAYERIAYPSCFEKKLTKAYTILRWFYIPSNPQKSASVIDAAYERYYAMANPDFDWQKEPRELPITSRFKFRLNRYRTIELLASVSEEPYYRIHRIYLRQQTGIRASQLIITLRRYKDKTGHWPENLDEIKPFAPPEIFVDPMNGNSFVYKLADDSFKLYSKGENNIDEGGERDQWDYPQTGADDWLIWPLRGPKTQKENADGRQQ
jgi:hypothetical protein